MHADKLKDRAVHAVVADAFASLEAEAAIIETPKARKSRCRGGESGMNLHEVAGREKFRELFPVRLDGNPNGLS
jgi:hypothetical protein